MCLLKQLFKQEHIERWRYSVRTFDTEHKNLKQDHSQTTTVWWIEFNVVTVNYHFLSLDFQIFGSW